MIKNCLQCKKDIYKQMTCSISDWENRVKFCSKECHDTYRQGKKSASPFTTFKKGESHPHEGLKGSDNPNWKGGKISLECKICSKQFEVNKARMNAKTCSRECAITYKRLSENREAMSKIHRDRVKAGLHNLYRGVTALYTLIRKSSQYRQWRKAVYEQDRYTCQICGVCGGDLQADHIKQFALILLENNINTIEDAIKCVLLWNTLNGRTLCVSCHRKTDTWGINNFVDITRQTNI